MTEALIIFNLLYLTCGGATFWWVSHTAPEGVSEGWAHRTVTIIVAVLSWPLIIWCLLDGADEE
jgi:hypothetical protein